MHCSTFNTLQHTATHCATLQHTTIHCNTLQHTLRMFTLNGVCQLGAAQHNTLQLLQHTATRCNTLRECLLVNGVCQLGAAHSLRYNSETGEVQLQRHDSPRGTRNVGATKNKLARISGREKYLENQFNNSLQSKFRSSWCGHLAGNLFSVLNTFVCVCVYIYVYIHVYIYIYMYMNTCI